MIRAVFFLPVIIASGLIIGILKGDVLSQMMLSGEKSSSLFLATALEDMLIQSGISSNLANFFTGMINNIFELSWKSGIQILLFLAGLQTIPEALYEASTIEGATKWEAFWKITFPMISPIILLNIIYTIIDGFTDYSNEVMLMISKLAKSLNIEYSATLSWIYFIIVFAIISTVYSIINKHVFYAVD